jgi:hypothetical protein
VRRTTKVSRRWGAGRAPVIFLALTLAFACVLLSAGTANATVHTYYGTADAYYGIANKSGYNFPDLNRVYRPLYVYFSVYYTDDVNAWGFKRNWWDNPLVWPYAGGYARSVCMHSDGDFPDPWGPTTCQYVT